jgi:hypothetical protein
VQPQLGLLKSTMQQLDSAFDEREYGASSFSGFIEKLVDEGFLAVRTVDGQVMVERRVDDEDSTNGNGARDQEDAIRMLAEVLQANVDILSMGIPAREVEAVVTAADPDFKETDYGFSEFAEVLNYAHDKGLVRVEADLEHGLRYYPGDELIGGSQGVGEDAEGEADPSDQAESSSGELLDESRPSRSRAPARGRGRRTTRGRSSAPRKPAASPARRRASTRRPAGAPEDADE